MFRRASRSSTAPYSPGLLKFLFTSAMFCGSIDSIPMKTHLPPDSAIRSTSSSSRSRLALICATHGSCAPAAMMSRSSDFVRLMLMARLSSMKKTAIWPALAAGARLEPEQFFDHRLVGAEADRVAEEARHGAELAAVGAAAPRLDGDDVERPHPPPRRRQERAHESGHEAELFERERLPGDRRIRLQARLAIMTLRVALRLIDLFQLAARGVLDDQGPGLVGLAERDGVGVARPAVAPQRLVGALGDVGAAHHDGNARRAQRVGEAVGSRDHPRHRADADEADALLADEAHQLLLSHRAGVAVDQDHLVAGRRERLEEEHPEVRHEVARHAVVRVVK